MHSAFDLSGQRVLITGATGGIGASTCFDQAAPARFSLVQGYASPLPLPTTPRVPCVGGWEGEWAVQTG